MKRLFALPLVLLIGACKTGSFEPIVIDLSKRSPSAAPTAVLTPTPTPPPVREASQIASSAPATAASVPPPPAATPIAPRPPSAAAPEIVRPAPPAAAVDAPKSEAVIDAQLDAFNRRDVESFLRAYAPDAVLYDFPDKVRQSGTEQIRRAYAKEFAESPAGQVAVSSRLVQGSYIIDHQTISGPPGHELASVVVIYEVRLGKIRRVWFLR